ncbi:MAG: dipeptidase [Bifidobacteriaceae bacterium]|jgi:membrane dipeptidase|nr:dipeptidase [Bifidobacteriaceae bacterium]
MSDADELAAAQTIGGEVAESAVGGSAGGSAAGSAGGSARGSAAAELVAAVLAETPIIDGHNDLPSVLRARAGYSVAGLDQVGPGRQTDLPRLRQGGVGAQFWSVWTPPDLPEAQAAVGALEQFDAIRRLVAAYPETLVFARTAADIRRAWSEGKIASLIGVEGGHAIAGSLGVLRSFARLGARYLTLTHGRNTAWADSATDQPGVRGLTEDGRAIVAELNRVGVLVDLSHTSKDTQLAALAVSRAPVIFSHSSAFAVSPHPRNVTDDVLEALAAGGGVVQAIFLADFLDEARSQWTAEALAWAKAQGPADGTPGADFWKPAPRPSQTPEQALAEQAEATGPASPFARLGEYAEAHPPPPVTIATVVAHIEHLREVAGIDHIGIGSDFDGTPSLPEGLQDVSGYPRLLEALAERGWSRSDLRALTGENVLRVVQDAEDAATDPLFA